MFRASSSMLFSSHHKHTASILDYLHITSLAQNKAFRSKTHLIRYPPLNVHFGLSSTRFHFITMLIRRMLIHFQLAATAPLRPLQRKGEGNILGNNANIGKKSSAVLGLGPHKEIHLGTLLWTHTDIPCLRCQG